MLAAQADETDEQRAERLEQAAEQAECNSGTLYEVEQDLRDLADHYADQNPDKLAQVRTLAKTYAPTLGMDPVEAEDILSVETVASLLSQYTTARPKIAALLVKSLHESFERRGLYDELGIETPTEPELQPPLTEGEE
jgi:hypothetical protein